ncbi:MAG TPA: class I SAM-dependent methyltransferase [Gammaproteobacteria bacterium]
MSSLAHRIHARYFRDWEHPYKTFEAEVERHLEPASVLLDAGCGRSAPVLARFRGKAARLIGIDAVEPVGDLDGIEYYQRNLTDTGLPDASVDLIMARSVVEHLDDPAATYAEFARVLKPGGRFVFLTANLWDYASLIAAVVPNRFHPWIVAHTEGRKEHDTFPTRYRSNTRRSITRFARATGFDVERFAYLGQHPRYLQFNGVLYAIGSLYEKTIAAVPSLHWLRGWILCTLRKGPGAGR